MTITALIAEYNPFHNGHAYHIREARRLTGADFLIVLMSGNFVQRGEPAVIDKTARAEMAVRCGADLVLELPVCYACGSAEYFAGGAVALLNALGCVDYLCFGSECGDLAVLQTAAAVLSDEPEEYRQELQKLLRQGRSFPLARQEALARYLAQNPGTERDAEIFSCETPASFLSLPNNILAIEYLKALIQSHSPIKPVTIRRMGSGYHDTDIGRFCSATALRRAFAEKADSNVFFPSDLSHDSAALPDGAVNFPLQIAASVPAEVCGILSANWQRTFPVFADDFSVMLHYRLLAAKNWQSYAACFDVSETLARRIFQMRHEFTDISSFVPLVKTRNLTEAFVRRALLHILLELPQPEKADGLPVYYARILGLRRSAGSLFGRIKKNGQVPLLSKLADAEETLRRFYDNSDSKAERALQFLSLEIRASEFYGAARTAKFKTPTASEYTRQIFILRNDKEI